MLPLLSLMALLAAPEIHWGPPGYAAASNSPEPPAMAAAWAPQAWPGGFAVMELVINTDDRPLEGARLEIEPPGKGIPAPEVLQMEPGALALPPLPESWSMPENSRRAVMLLYRVPPDAEPGRHTHQAWLRADNRPRSQAIELTLDVAAIPPRAMLHWPAFAMLEWPPSRADLDNETSLTALLDAWRLAPALLWPAPPDGATLRPEQVNLFVAAQVRLETFAPLHLGVILPPEHAAPKGFSEHLEAARLERWTPWMRDALWSSGVQAEIEVRGGVDAPASLAAQIERYRALLPGASLMLAGPFLPELQGRTESWALLPAQSSLAPRIANGVDAADSQPCVLEVSEATPGAPLPEWPALETTCAAALDGVTATRWILPPLQRGFVELLNPGKLRIEKLTLLGDVATPRVITAFAGQPPSESTIAWEKARPGEAVGHFRFPGPFDSLRIEFESSNSAQGIHEILLNEPAPPDASTTHEHVTPWSLLQPGSDVLLALLSAEAGGAAGIHLGRFEVGGPMLLVDGDGVHLRSRDMLALMQSLQDATLMRSARAHGLIGPSNSAALATASGMLFDANAKPEEQLARLRDYHDLRRSLVDQIESAARR